VIADAVDNYLNTTGSTDAAADLMIETSGDSELVRFVLSNPAFGNAASGVITGASLPKNATAGATGTAAKGALQDRDNADAVLFSVTASGGGGDVIASNTSINNGQSCSLDTLTYTAPA
jgi:hypothetical protein